VLNSYNHTTHSQSRNPIPAGVVLLLCLFVGWGTVHGNAQNLENSVTGTVINSGVIRFRDNNGTFKNDAPYSNISNNIIQFEGTGNTFTDGAGDTKGATALGHNPQWRVPGMVRYAQPADGQQLVQQRYYKNLEMADKAGKLIPDSVFVSEQYTIFLSGPRTYNGTFFYDGTEPQYIMQEKELSGTVNRYNNMTLLHGPKTVASGYEVRMDGVFWNDTVSPLYVEGDFTWGSHSFVNAQVTIWAGGRQTTGWGLTHLHANVDVANGLFVVADHSDTVIIYPDIVVGLQNNAAAQLAMGENTHLLVLGDYRNAYPNYTNATFHPTSLVEYAGQQDPQVIQATAESNPYGNLTTANTLKTANGNVYVASALMVRDTNVMMVPHTMSLTVGDATYTNNAEVIGAFRRLLRGADTNKAYVYNNSETHSLFSVLPQEFTMDVRPQTRPNDYNDQTDIFRKITVTAEGSWQAKIRAGYKVTDIPSTWVPTTSERLVKMYNAFAPPNEHSIKLTPTVPPTYTRRPLSQSTGIAYVELTGIASAGPDNLRLDNGNDLLLRASRDVLKAVASGRWSNPFTWDEAREPEPEDRVIIDGFTVHTGYVRANDYYSIREAYPDSMARQVIIGSSPNSALLFGYEAPGVWNSFSLVPDSTVSLLSQRIVPSFVQADALDTSADNIDGGLIVYRGSSFLTPNLIVAPGAAVNNAGTVLVGVP